MYSIHPTYVQQQLEEEEEEEGGGGRRSSSNFVHAFFYPLSHCFSWASPAHQIPGGLCSFAFGQPGEKVMDG
jgi:hypothetical protein